MVGRNASDHRRDLLEHGHDVFWLSPINQLLWHIHRSSSILFCLLVALNLLAGAENHKMAEKERKNLTSSSINVIVPTDDDELTRKIMALFDYEERWMSDENITVYHNNGTESKNGTYLADQQEFVLFNTDPKAEFGAQNLTGNLTANEQLMPKTEKAAFGADHLQDVAENPNMINVLAENENRTEPRKLTPFSKTTVSPDLLANKLIKNTTVSTITEAESITNTSTVTAKVTTEASNGTNVNGNEGTKKIDEGTVESSNTTKIEEGTVESSNTTTVFGPLLEVNTTSTPAPAQEFVINVTKDYRASELVGYSSTFPISNASTVSQRLESNSTNNFVIKMTTATQIAMTISSISETPSTASVISTISPAAASTTSSNIVNNEIIAINGSATETPAGQQEIEQKTTDQQTIRMSIEARDSKRAEAGGELAILTNETKLGREEAMIGGNNRIEEMAGEEDVKQVLEELKKRVERRLNIGDAEFVELNDYRHHLRHILSNVESALTKWSNATALQHSDFPKSRRLIAISSSLPNRNSDVFIARKNAILSSISSNLDDIRKSPPHLGTSTSGQSPATTTTTTTTTTTFASAETETTAATLAPLEENTGKSLLTSSKTTSSEDSEERVAINPRKTGFFRAEYFSSKYFPFNTLHNLTAEQCKHLSQSDLVHELKQKGTYNPELMAWDVSGVFRFLDKTITDQYERQSKPHKSSDQAVKRNVEALERLLAELNLRCDVRSPEVLSRLGNLTLAESKRSIISPSLRHRDQLMRYKRNSVLAEQLVNQTLNSSSRRTVPPKNRPKNKKQKLIGDVHIVPFGCDKRGGSEDGYLRLCGACQAIRKLPDEFFPPFINEVMCDEDKACLYFYDYPHGKCKQKHMNFVVLRNVGTQLCQIWEKYNMNVRVSCECFVDEMSFFSKYV